MAVELTTEQIEAGMKNSPAFGIDFIIGNQPEIIIDRLKEKGYSTTDTAEKAEVVLNNLYTTDPQLLLEIVSGIPYDNARDNWTGGLGVYFPAEAQDGQPPSRGINWGGLLSGLGGLFTGLGTAVGGGAGVGGYTPEQLEAMRIAEEKRQEEERKRKQQNMLLYGVMALVVTIILVAIWKKGKTK